MSLNSVKNYFKQYNMDTHIVEFPVSSATVELAAQAIGCKEQEIAKTMSFHVGDEVIVIVMAGDARIDNKKYKSFFLNTHKPQVCYKHVFNKFLLNSIRNKEQTKIKKTVSADYGYSNHSFIRKLRCFMGMK